MKRLTIRPSKIKAALNWLKKNNILFEDIAIDSVKIIKPTLIHFSSEVNSVNANVERAMEMTVIFPDDVEPTTANAGMATSAELKENALIDLMCDKDTVLVSRPEAKMLKEL